VPPSFKETSGFAYHATGYVPVPAKTSTIMNETQDFPDEDPPGTLCDDPRFGNFALRPARPTCILTTRPRLGGSAEMATASPDQGAHSTDSVSVDYDA